MISYCSDDFTLLKNALLSQKEKPIFTKFSYIRYVSKHAPRLPVTAVTEEAKQSGSLTMNTQEEEGRSSQDYNGFL